MAGQAGSRLRGLVTMSGMVAFLGAMSMVPRISIIRDQDSTIIKYDHMKIEASGSAPRDEGIVLSPGIKPTSTGRLGLKHWDENDWIFDTGATSHVCGNRSLLHRYSRLNPYTNKTHGQAVAHFGPNPIAIVGIGDTTFLLPAGAAHPHPPPSRLSNPFGPGPSSSGKNATRVQPLTIKNIMHIPDAGINIISWSQLKKSSKSLNLALVEGNDGALVVQSKDGPLMRFVLRDGLYFLDQAVVGRNIEPVE